MTPNEKRQRLLELPKLIAAETRAAKREMLSAELAELRREFPIASTEPRGQTYSDQVVDLLEGGVRMMNPLYAAKQARDEAERAYLAAQRAEQAPPRVPYVERLSEDEADRLLFAIDNLAAAFNGVARLSRALPLYQLYLLAGLELRAGDEHIGLQPVDGFVLGEIVKGLPRAIKFAEVQTGRTFSREAVATRRRGWRAPVPR